MSTISDNIASFNKILEGTGCKLIAVSKTMPNEKILEAYNTGFKRFGENRAQELKDKYLSLPYDIEWHMIGHLQTNKVKLIAPFVSMIHAVDSFKLANEINRQAERNGRIIPCLIQVHIAKEESKYGYEKDNLISAIEARQFNQFGNIKFIGLMGMATFTQDEERIRSEFKMLKELFEEIKSMSTPSNFDFKELSMGMSNDYRIAIEEGSTMIRIGSNIFGARNQ